MAATTKSLGIDNHSQFLQLQTDPCNAAKREVANALYGDAGRYPDDGEEDEGKEVEKEQGYEDGGRTPDRHDGSQVEQHLATGLTRRWLARCLEMSKFIVGVLAKQESKTTTRKSLNEVEIAKLVMVRSIPEIDGLAAAWLASVRSCSEPSSCEPPAALVGWSSAGYGVTERGEQCSNG
ncbi:conserved hypothetical protein [Histoplasma mississippiense (nom. inval.)]|uniref:conserved hypothetical protein n=1 Tax=Ajellomyces capsulatus (strain NAm1 / WU24) TaxID=2059318 RepID=UPI000157CA79|nr:conserved hypothetical protein [Histoplasma mississippiense (nom. inval.)]EDN09313.1 conserved hypothetical protein [Histoplasma mississippiense (nom. inval.)]